MTSTISGEGGGSEWRVYFNNVHWKLRLTASSYSCLTLLPYAQGRASEVTTNTAMPECPQTLPKNMAASENQPLPRVHGMIHPVPLDLHWGWLLYDKSHHAQFLSRVGQG